MARPATLNKHQLRTEATTRKLLDAAFTVFTRDGFAAARIEDIAAEAGYTRGAFYAHYRSKSDLFFDLLRHQAEDRFGELHRNVSRANTVEERRQAIRSDYLGRASARQWWLLLLEFKLYAIREGRRGEELAEVHRELRRTLHQSVTERLGCELAPEDQLEAVKVGLEAAIQGVVLERAYDPKRLTDAQTRELLGKIFDALIPPLE